MQVSSHCAPPCALRVTSSSPPLTRAAVLELLDRARRIKVVEAGQPLRGKNLALLRRPTGTAPSALHAAALALGARVAHVQLGDPLPQAEALRGIAQILGRLYDAVDCSALAPALVRQLQASAGIPVYEGLDGDMHPAHALAALASLHDPAAGLPERVWFAGQGGAPGVAALRALMALMGIEMRQLAPSDTRGDSQSQGPHACVIDATDALLWRIRARSGAVGEPLRLAHHRAVMQAMMIGTIKG